MPATLPKAWYLDDFGLGRSSPLGVSSQPSSVDRAFLSVAFMSQMNT